MDVTQKIKRRNWLVKLIFKILKRLDFFSKYQDMINLKPLEKFDPYEDSSSWMRKVNYETGDKCIMVNWCGVGANTKTYFGETFEITRAYYTQLPDNPNRKILSTNINGKDQVIITAEIIPLESIVTGRPKVIGKL